MLLAKAVIYLLIFIKKKATCAKVVFPDPIAFLSLSLSVSVVDRDWVRQGLCAVQRSVVQDVWNSYDV